MVRVPHSGVAKGWARGHAPLHSRSVPSPGASRNMALVENHVVCVPPLKKQVLPRVSPYKMDPSYATGPAANV